MAFVAPSLVALRAGVSQGRGTCSARRRVPLMCAAGGPAAAASDEKEGSQWAPAFDSGAELRDSLERVSQERREQSARTEERLNDMSAQLASIVSSIREQTGLPPMAAPPAPRPKAPAPARARTPASSDVSDDGADEPYMDPSNFGYDSAAGWQVLASENQLPAIDESGVKFRIECDQDGCSIIELQGDAPAGPGVRSQFLQAGPGYRVGYDPDGPSSFCATVGNDNWLLALSRDEIRHFKRLTLALQKKMDRVARGLEEVVEQKHTVRRSGDGMFNERAVRTGADCSVELESKLLWVQALGKPEKGSYGIRAIFMEGRQSEVFWPKKTVPGMLAGVANLAIE